ncbi:MAG: lytic transglycosylase domain-containing protein [Veillonellales bacterium]
MTQVIQRIHTIEQRFSRSIGSSSSNSSGNFPQALAGAQGQAITSSSVSTAANDSDIKKMLYLAAKKYGVDPKLALAVATAESNLSPDAVSSAGAVGVMQLMPSTAQSLGVRNIRDPRENIDGGVQYLGQLLTEFNGDMTKAVAAYNAGPQAVKNYGGVPPYSETQSYVAKVLSLYNQ